MIIKLNSKLVGTINKFINDAIDDERENLGEIIEDQIGDDISELSDDDLFEKYKNSFSDHIWFSIYELQNKLN